MGEAKKVILITGCSSGIGRATAELLGKHGHAVIATARRDESVTELQPWAEQISAAVHKLDVTNPETIKSVVSRTLEAHGRIDVLINNAGYGQLGAVEDVSTEDLRRQFEVNVFGLAAVTRAVLPSMRQQASGRIVNVSSVAGKVALPFMGAYCASKFAVEGLSDTLRMEVARFGIKVVVVEPGPVGTQFSQNAFARSAGVDAHGDSPYYADYQMQEQNWNRRIQKHAASAEEAAVTVCLAALSPQPRTRYAVSRIGKLALLSRRLLSDGIVDAMTKKTYGVQ